MPEMTSERPNGPRNVGGVIFTGVVFVGTLFFKYLERLLGKILLNSTNSLNLPSLIMFLEV